MGGPGGGALSLALLSHATATVAFALLCVLMVASRPRSVLGGYLTAACLLTAVWAGIESFDAASHGAWWGAAEIAELVRSSAWILFLLAVLLQTCRDSPDVPRRLMPVLIVGFCLANLALEIYLQVNGGDGLGIGSADPAVLGRLSLAVLGLLLVENLFSNTRTEHRWGIKFLCLGIGGLFAYDLFLYADAALLHRLNPSMLAARGLTNALVVPLIAVSAARNPTWRIDMAVSRRFVFHSATLVGAGIYLLVMSAAGYYVRRFGGQWGTAVQTIFFFAAVLLLLVVSFSGSVRGWLRVVIAKHFFSYRYDYREEWLRFIRTISSLENGRVHERAIEAVAAIVDSPEGAIFLAKGDDRFALLGTWNCRAEPGPHIADPGFTEFLETRGWVIDLDEHAARPEVYGDMAMPSWLAAASRAWLVVPLLHNDRLTGVMLLGRARAPRRLNWEDYDILQTVGRQAASYLAEHEAARALAESQQFDEFNRRFAFVIHDVKNLVSQLSLLLNNAKKHKGNPAFQEDMIETVHESVEKMKQMLIRLHRGGKEAASHMAIELGPFLKRAVERNASGSADVLSFEGGAEGVAVVADEERLGMVMAHLIDNALEAVAGKGRVSVRLATDRHEAIIEVADDGPGMDPAFVRDELFRPFRSTKSAGFGIGAYESREFIRQLGGRLDVVSEVGRGTTFRIVLPAIESAAADRELERV